MSAERLFRKLKEALETAGIPYMVTGPFVSAQHGVPRATHDIDVVIAPTGEQIGTLLKQFSASDYYAEPDKERHIRDASGVIEIQRTQLDITYIERRVTALGLEREWQMAGETGG